MELKDKLKELRLSHKMTQETAAEQFQYLRTVS